MSGTGTASLTGWARRAAQLGVKAAAAGRDVVAAPFGGITVLIYHRVGRRTSMEVDISDDVFAAQIAWLTARHDVIDLDEALRRLASDDPADHHDAVVLTFDDGTADFADVAVPILAEHGAPATLYVATDHVERQRPFPEDGVPLSWASLADTLTTGLVTVGSHTDTHLLLDRAGPAEAAAELDRSIELIGCRLGVRAEHFAYPKALPASGAVEAEVRSRFRSAAVAGTVPNPFGRTDPHRLARSPIQHGDPAWAFRRKARGGRRLEDELRSLRNRRRYADLTT